MPEPRSYPEIIDRLVGVAMLVAGLAGKALHDLAVPVAYEIVYLVVALYLVLGRDSDGMSALLERIEALVLGKVPERIVSLAERGAAVLERLLVARHGPRAPEPRDPVQPPPEEPRR